jgi:hypothetical protein
MRPWLLHPEKKMCQVMTIGRVLDQGQPATFFLVTISKNRDSNEPSAPARRNSVRKKNRPFFDGSSTCVMSLARPDFAAREIVEFCSARDDGRRGTFSVRVVTGREYAFDHALGPTM